MHLGFLRCLILAVAVLAALWPRTVAHAGTSLPTALPVLSGGGYVVEEPFRSFILAHGGLERFGQPLSDAVYDPEERISVQYFTYARLERRGNTVQLTRLGSMYAAGRESEPPFWPVPVEDALESDRVYVAETRHTLGGAFGWYHQRHGGVPLLGYPISEEFYEPQPDGSLLLVQYFERVRLSYHPELAGSVGEVQRAPLGAWLAEQKAHLLNAPRRPLEPLASATIRYRAGSAAGANIELAAARLNGVVVAPGAELSFLRTLGSISLAAGFKPGPGILGGTVVETMVGGGVCTVATLLYRAAWKAGLPISERRGHSRWLDAFADWPGMDAAVADPGLDLRIRNDTGAPLYVIASAQHGRATVTLWGRSDGRSVTLGAPKVHNGTTALSVTNTRVIRAANGAVLRHERVESTYAR